MEKERFNIGLLGNPNSGKSSLFNQLTGLRQHVANFPGVTVDKKIGVSVLDEGIKVDVIDFPGTYSLFPNSSDEKVVISLLSNPDSTDYPDLVVYVADVTQLERHTLLATQIVDLGIPMIFCINMIDLLEEKGGDFNISVIKELLGVETLLVSSKTGKNLHELKSTILRFVNGDRKPFVREVPFYKISDIEEGVARIVAQENLGNNSYQQKILGHHFQWLPHISSEVKERLGPKIKSSSFEDIKYQIIETLSRFKVISPAIKRAFTSSAGQKKTFTDKLDDILTHRFFGPVIFFTIMFFVFQAIYAWAEYPMMWIEDVFAGLGSGIRGVLPEGWLSDLLVDGVVAGLAGIMVFIPQITILFFIIAMLEEMGYMSRAVFMFDGIMQRFGLNGRSIVSLISSAACAIPAIMATRTIGDWKERLTTIMVSPLISCSARIPVYTVLIGFVVPPGKVFGIFNAQGVAFMGLYLLGIVATLVSAIVFKKILKGGKNSSLMIELPHYKPPIWKNVFLTLKEKVGTFIIEAGKIILIISVILWFLASYGPASDMRQAETDAITLAQTNNLDEETKENLIASKKIEASYAGHLGKFIEPVIRPLGFDWKIGIALITSFAAREVFVGTMATIYSVGSTDDEATVRQKMAAEKDPITMKPRYDLPTSLSLLLFYVFAMQCMSTLAITKRETKSWKWPAIQFIYMGALAYFSSLLAFQILS